MVDVSQLLLTRDRSWQTANQSIVEQWSAALSYYSFPMEPRSLCVSMVEQLELRCALVHFTRSLVFDVALMI
jgi:hypothetical protein